MRHVRMLGLCLVAVLAVGAYAVSSASALPEWGKCEAKAGGNYKDSNCTEKAKPSGSGSYEWKKGAELAPVKFQGASVGSGGVLSSGFWACGNRGAEGRRETRQECTEEGMSYEEATFVQVECEREENTGEAVGKASVRNISVTFLGCKVFGSLPCANGPTEGEINVNTLAGKLGYINKAEKKVGLLLEPAKKHGEFAKFNCGGIVGTTVGVGNKKEGAFYPSSGCIGACPGTTPEEEKHGGYDGIISPITPVNQTTTEYTQVYTTNGSESDPQNVPSSFERKHIELLEGYLFPAKFPGLSTLWSPAAEEITNANETCEVIIVGPCPPEKQVPGEIKA